MYAGCNACVAAALALLALCSSLLAILDCCRFHLMMGDVGSGRGWVGGQRERDGLAGVWVDVARGDVRGVTGSGSFITSSSSAPSANPGNGVSLMRSGSSDERSSLAS